VFIRNRYSFANYVARSRSSRCIELYSGIRVILIEVVLEYARLYQHVHIRNGKNRLIVQRGNENVEFVSRCRKLIVN